MSPALIEVEPRPSWWARRRSLTHSGPAGRALARQDLAAYRAIRAVPLTPTQLTAVQRFSHLGEHAACWIALGTVGYVVDQPRRGRWAKALATLFGAYVANVALKNVIRRRRPLLEDLPHLTRTPTKLSFPSSHATSSFAAARAMGPLVGPRKLYALASLMALSRVRLGVHYPLDVLAGAALGTAVGSLGR